MTAPLVPPEVVIPVRYVPIYSRRLFGSTLFAVATPLEFRAAFALWLNSWEQRPAGSLPSTDRELCRLAELGGDLARWGKVKRMALRHWQLCDDGRLYHPVVAEYVLDAWKAFNKRRARTEAATTARLARLNGDATSNVTKGKKQRNVHQRIGSDQNPPSPLSDFSKNGDGRLAGNGLALAPAVNPKFIGHSPPCSCANCTRWAEQQRSAG
jgi:hypothetical protein